MRGHEPSNEVTGESYAPIYYDTKKRMENVFGKRDSKIWADHDQTCSKCYSVLLPETIR